MEAWGECQYSNFVTTDGKRVCPAAGNGALACAACHGYCVEDDNFKEI
jgi:hypothetical protein